MSSTNTKNRRSVDDVPRHTNREARRESTRRSQSKRGSEYGKPKPIVKIGTYIIIFTLGIVMVASMFPMLNY